MVDNDSDDDSREQLLNLFPEIRWIQMNYNAGFARANNEGIRQASGAIVLLLNADTLIENRGIENCYESFVDSEYAACGAQLLNQDRTPQISGNYFVRGGVNYLLPLPYIGRFVKWAGELAGREAPHVPNADSSVEVD